MSAEAVGKTVILGLGNILLKDEGIGVHVAQALGEASLPEWIEVIDGGTSPDAFHLIEGAAKLVLVDAARGGGEPGSIYRLSLNDVAARPELSLSSHDIGLIDSLQLLALLGQSPAETLIIGIEPKEIDWGLELSPELKQRVPRIIELILEEVACSSQSKSHLKRS